MSFGPKPGQTGQIRNIAVIGSGIAGLSVAWLLSARHKVTVFERDDWAGGHSHTVDIDGPDGPQPVDTGFIVYNTANYPNLAALFDHLAVVTKPSIMSFAASLRGGAVEYSSADLNRLFGQRSNLVRPRFWRMVRDIVRFYGQAQGMVEAPGLDGLTLGQFLEREGFGRALAEDHVLPMCAAIWSTTAGEIRDLPLKSFLRFFASHGLLDIRHSPQWRTVAGGARQYVERLKAPLGKSVLVGTGAKRIARSANGVVVEDASGRRHSFSDVVIATHADQALALLGDADPIERRVLGAFRTVANRAVLHQDAALMPRRRRVWSSWNYIAGRASEDRQALCVTYWMNSLQGIRSRQPVLVTLNPHIEPRPQTVKGEFAYSHPIFDHAALAAQRDLPDLQGRRRTWFCGSYFGYGFHEDALQSGLMVAEALGGVRRPWTVANESGRMPEAPAQLEAAE